MLDVPDVMALDYLSQTANEFAERTLALKRTLRHDLGWGQRLLCAAGRHEKGLCLLPCRASMSTALLYTPPSPVVLFNACYVPVQVGQLLYDAATGMVDVSPRPTEDSPGGLRITLAVAPRSR